MQSHTTALSIIQSLLFQMAVDNAELQTILVEVKERELMSLQHAARTWKKLLQCAGPTYVIIDGLDEIDEYECKILLLLLVELPKECKSLKLLISSQAKANIVDVLEKKSKVIRLHHRNSGSIQAYVSRRTEGLFENSEFDSDTKREIRTLLAPLAANAKGEHFHTY